jgi:hypothetical protein
MDVHVLVIRALLLGLAILKSNRPLLATCSVSASYVSAFLLGLGAHGHLRLCCEALVTCFSRLLQGIPALASWTYCSSVRVQWRRNR